MTYLPMDERGVYISDASTLAGRGSADGPGPAIPIDLGTNLSMSGTTLNASGGSNAFGTVAVSGQSDVVADSVSDTLTLVAGANVTLTTSAGGDSVTIASTSGGTGPGAELDYAEFTSPVTISATTEATANAIATGNSVAYDGATIVLIEFFAPISQPSSSAGDNIIYYLYEDGASIGQLTQHQKRSTSTERIPIFVARRMTPTNASHTYAIHGIRTTANGQVTAGAGGSGAVMPGFIRITAV